MTRSGFGDLLRRVGVEDRVEATLEAVLEGLESYVGSLRVDDDVEEQRDTLSEIRQTRVSWLAWQ